MFFKIVNILNLSYSKNKKIIKVNLNKNELELIKIFIKLNLIKFIKQINKFQYFIYLNNKKKLIFKNLKNLYKYSQKKNVKLTVLKKLIFKKNIFLILSTSRGLKTIAESVKLKISGIILIMLFN